MTEVSETRLRLEAQYLQPEAQAIYKLRKQKVELPFGHIKRNLGAKDFLLGGIDGVKAEMSVLAACFIENCKTNRKLFERRFTRM